jgi:histidinol-phosphate aminotransferase
MTARSTVAAMTAYTLELREAAVKLNQNESPFDLAPELKRELLERMVERPWNIYPDFESSMLRGALATAYGLEPENVLVGNGSNELLAAAIGAFVGPGTPVVFPRPTFTLYEKLVTIAGGLPIPVDFDPADGTLPLDEMLRILSTLRGAVAIVCSPNNPTGSVLRDGGIDQLLATGATVLLDRAYGDFDDNHQPPTTNHQLASNDRLVTFHTFSKAWGLAALRVGWLASTARTCREIRKVKLPYSLNVISETIASLALERRELRDANVARTLAERDRVIAGLQEVNVLTFPTRANFVAFRVPNAKAVFEALYARGILIRDVSSYPRMENCLRVTIGTPAENDAFLDAMKELA